jgi:4-amino-4-deoxy-L-arabinose transferase-like glycosyltransferase
MSDKKIYIILIFLITLIGGFLRFYKLPQLTTLSAEQGDNYLAIKNLAENKQIPLVGPPTSHEWLSFGPLFYYLMTPIMLIANYTPLAPAYFFALIYTAIIPINYIVINKIFNKQTALLSSLFISVSPLWLHFSRAARFYCFVPFIFYFLLWFIAKKKKNFFVIGLLIGVMLNFHLSPLFIIPAVLSYFWMTKTKINWKLLSVGFLIPLLPLIIHDSLSGFKMISQFLLWIPYRIAGFLNLYPKNNLTPVTLKQTIINFYQFFQYSFFPKNFPWQISTSIYLVFAYLFLFNSKKLNFQKTRKLILLIFGWGILSLLIHSQPPLHYFLPLFPIPPILFA